mmetsp:Transcript_58637/g.95483  ORF Transcript_58637/g.95483 Transcript_58637/m.95483 type:complete len:273 (-) Transcript_58637:290-1108(-)
MRFRPCSSPCRPRASSMDSTCTAKGNNSMAARHLCTQVFQCPAEIRRRWTRRDCPRRLLRPCCATSTAMHRHRNRPTLVRRAMQPQWQLITRQAIPRNPRRATWVNSHTAASRMSPVNKRQPTVQGSTLGNRRPMLQGNRRIRPPPPLPAVDMGAPTRHRPRLAMEPRRATALSMDSLPRPIQPIRPLLMRQRDMAWGKVHTTTCSSPARAPRELSHMEATKELKARCHRLRRRKCSTRSLGRLIPPLPLEVWRTSRNSNTWTWCGSSQTCL